jgi:hypothetical protein
MLVIFAIVVLGLEGPMFLDKDHWVGWSPLLRSSGSGKLTWLEASFGINGDATLPV